MQTRHSGPAHESHPKHHGPALPDEMLVQLMELRGRVMVLEPHPVPATLVAELIDLLLGRDAEDPPVVGDQASRAHRVHPPDHVHAALKRHHEAKQAEAQVAIDARNAEIEAANKA